MTFINAVMPFLLIVSMSVLPGSVFSSRYVERASPLMILVPFMARIMSPPMGMVAPAIVASWPVDPFNPAASAGLGGDVMMLVISHPYVMFMPIAFAM